MIKVAFVCLGNICRSPMAEFILKNMVKEGELDPYFEITSYGTSNEEEGNPIHREAKRTLFRHGIVGSHTATQLTLANVEYNDYILVMDSENYVDVLRLTQGRYRDKIFKLCDFTPFPRDVADPWYTLNFEQAFYDIEDGCKGFLHYLARLTVSKYNIRI